MTSPTLAGPARPVALALCAAASEPLRRALTTTEAAAYTGISVSTLEKKRVYGGGPVFLKLGRGVRYRVQDLDSYMDERTFASTSEYTLH